MILPLAFVARRQLPGAQRTISCTTASVATKGTLRCTAWDRATGDVRRVPCEDAQQALDDALEGAGPLTSSAITVVSTVSPVEVVPVPASHVWVDGMKTAVFPSVPRTSASDAKVALAWNAIERHADGTIAPDAARALLDVCVGAPPGEAEQRTVALMVVPRDDRGAALVVLGALILLGLLLARSATVEIERTKGELRIVERFGPFGLRRHVVRPQDVADVAIAQGPAGPFLGRHVELVLRDGVRIPLVRSYFALGPDAHERAAAALRGALGLDLARER